MESLLKSVELAHPTCKHVSKVVIGTFGATIHQFIVNNGTSARNIVLGYDTAEEYEPPLRPASHPYHGSTVGRYSNRIAKGSFTLNGQDYQLAINNGPNALHGGPTGFSERQWSVEKKCENSVTLAYTSEDGEEGYPCKVTVHCTYTLIDDCLKIKHEGWISNPFEKRETILNLTNHAYFNLTGQAERTILGH